MNNNEQQTIPGTDFGANTETAEGKDFFDGGHLLASLKSLAAFARQIDAKGLARSGTEFVTELAAILRDNPGGYSFREDVRFKDPAWVNSAFFRRLSQSYLAGCDKIRQLADSDRDMDWHEKEQIKFLLEIALSAASPGNFLLTNPAALEKAKKTRGKSLLRGLSHLLNDLADGRVLPRHANPGQFAVGKNLAITPGSVVFRNDVLELIQYQPATADLLAEPTLILPPQISRYYFLDLAPGRSFVEYAVARGIPTFIISWKNPGPGQRDWGFDTYIGACLEAVDAVCSISRSKKLNILGVCAGGITATIMYHIMQARGDHRVARAAYAVTLLDFEVPCPLGAFQRKSILNFTHKRSRKTGMLPGRALGNTFNWMRPNDLVWRYWINNYLLGNEPPAFDILFWNDDITNLSYALHKQFLNLYEYNLLCTPGALQVLGQPVDLSEIELDTFVVGADADHLTPWRGCFRTTQLIRGESRFVLSNAGHIAGLINPPNNPKAKYLIGPATSADPDSWKETAVEQQGTWWEAWADWLASSVQKTKPAAATLGNRRYPVLEAAPGQYVRS